MGERIVEFNVGKREQNRAQLKLKIMETFIENMRKVLLHDLNVEEVSRQIGISKVTFFNYFHTKEEVIEYYIQLWQFKMAYEIHVRKLKGKKAVYFLFDSVSEHPSADAIMNALWAYFIKTDCYMPTLLSEYELYLYHEQAYLQGFRSVPLNELIEEALHELGLSDEKEQILSTNLISGFYGIPFVHKLGQGRDLKKMYHAYLDALFV